MSPNPLLGRRVVPKGPEDEAYNAAVVAFEARDRDGFQSAMSALWTLAKGARLRRQHKDAA